MSKLDTVKKVMLYQKDKSGFVKEPTVKEMADLVVLVLSQVKVIEDAIKAGRLDGKTPIADVDYLSKSGALSLITKGVNDALAKVDNTLNSKAAQIDSEVRASLDRIRDGKDGIVSEEEIQRAAEIALSMLELPDFDTLVTAQITSNGDAIRDALELLSGDARYKVQIADVDGLADALSQISTMRSSGGIGKNQVYGFIREAIADGTITVSGGSVSDDAYGGTWNGVTDVAPSKNAVYDKIEALVLGAGTGDVVGPVSAVDSRIAAFDGITGKLIKDGGKTIANVLNTDNHTDGTTNKVYTATEKTKLAGIEAGAEVNNISDVNATDLTDGGDTTLHTHSAYALTSHNHTGVYQPLATVLTNTTASFTSAQETKLAGIATGATANSSDATLLARANHTGTQTASTISDFASAALTAAPAETTTTAGALINGATAATPNDTDFVATALSAGVLQKITWTNVKAFLKTYFDTLYQAAGSYLTTANISDTAYGAGWNGVTTVAPSKNAVYDEVELRAPKASPTFSGTVTIGTLTGVLRADTGVVSTDSDVTDLVTKSVASDVNTGTSTANVITPDALAGSNLGIRYAQCVLNGTTALTTSEKVYFRIPAALNGMNLVSVTGTVGTGASGASSSGTPTFTVKNVTDNQQMLSTSLTIDATEYTSATAATAAVINTTYDDVATDDLIEVAVTTAGTGVTYATVTLGFQLP